MNMKLFKGLPIVLLSPSVATMESTIEVVSFQQQAIEIPPINDDFKPEKAPSTGEEFLMHMLFEKKCVRR